MNSILDILREQKEMSLKGNLYHITQVNFAYNTNHLVNYMLEVADKPLSVDMIKQFHRMLKTGTSDERKSWFNVGDYKKLAKVT